MKIKTHIKASESLGKITAKHNQTVTRDSKVKSGIKAGGIKNSMPAINRFAIMLLIISLCFPSMRARPAQDNLQGTPTGKSDAQDLLIIIRQETVCFSVKKDSQELRLQIFDQVGELIYDSGVTAGPEITWSLQRGDGEQVRSGLYSYTLTLKEVGAEAAQARRGHLIVDRAKERAGQTDRLWITSQNDGGVGTELTVARNEDVTLAGTSASMDQKSGRAAETVTGDRKSELKNDNNAAAVAVTSGTIGRIAKFVSATDLGNSVMTELNGNIGIGTSSPGTKLAVQTATSSYGIVHTDGDAVLSTFVGTGTSATTSGGWLGTVSNHDLRFFTANGPARMTIDTAGNVGIGTASPQTKLDVAGQTRTQSLQITGGSDFSENFEVNDTMSRETTTLKVEAGLVVSLDPTNPGKLQLSTKAYDRRVAGVISGAGGVKPGMVMSQEGTLADGKHPVALSGRVYCWVDASEWSVEVGDLLTTSSTPGHAMKAADATKTQGAIIGKAMTGLKEGKGLVLVLVTLQ